MVLLGGGGLVLNALLGIINERGWYRWWLIYVLALLDVLLVGVLVVWFGHGGFVVAFLIAVLPYAFDQGHTVGNFLVLTAALAYLGASYLHGVLYGDAGGLTAAGLETVGSITVAWALKQIPATLIRRIREARDVMGEAERGQLAVRAPAEESDELGFLEKSFNRMLGEIGATISTVQREADEVAAFAEQLAASAEELHATSETVTHTAQQLARDLAKQRELAEAARGESAKAADQAESLRVRAELMQVDAARLVGRRSGGGSAWRGRARRSAPWVTRCGPRRPRWPGCRGCPSGSAGSRRPSRASPGRPTCSPSTRRSRRPAPKSMGRGSPSWPTKSARSPGRPGSRRGRWRSSSPSCAPGSTPPRGRCSRGKRRCGTSAPSRPRPMARSRSCIRGSSSWATS